jgi:putative DNA primase/helicase
MSNSKNLPEIRDQARDRWPGILRELGVDERFLRNKHGPCPFCGGKDRYRFDDRDGKGTFFCNQCGPGDGMEFVMRYRKISFKEAAELVRGILATC